MNAATMHSRVDAAMRYREAITNAIVATTRTMFAEQGKSDQDFVDDEVVLAALTTAWHRFAKHAADSPGRAVASLVWAIAGECSMRVLCDAMEHIATADVGFRGHPGPHGNVAPRRPGGDL